jgi:predicted ATPase
MFIFNYNNIPNQLLLSSHTDEDINILIGENGSGKSLLLNILAKIHSQNSNVIAVANTIYDKFDSRNSKFKILRSSTGRTLARTTLGNAFRNLATEDLKRLRNIANTLEYIGFEPTIGIKLKGIDSEFREKIIESNLSAEQKEVFLYFLNRYADAEFYDGRIVKIDFYTEKFYDIRDSYLIQMFLYENELKKLKLINGINIYLYKNGENIPLNKASSGELTLVTSLIFITSIITENSVILIDEPENSLHPKWQIEYVKKITELFYFYQPKIVIATHSPLIINGAEANSKNLQVFKGKKGTFELHNNKTMNVEEIYEDFFDLTTPENRYISEYVIEQLNNLSSRKINLNQFEILISELKQNSYDIQQKSVFDGILSIGRDVMNNIE